MECESRAAAFLVSDLFFQPIQREACRFDPMPRTLNHTPAAPPIACILTLPVPYNYVPTRSR